jgi:hypothetical protein
MSVHVRQNPIKRSAIETEKIVGPLLEPIIVEQQEPQTAERAQALKHAAVEPPQ